jgi:glycosyltransferase involved in cell wall biosynthesis
MVSVILPTFNRLQFLRPAVDSVFAQTYTDWELIVADDGSNDETRLYLGALAMRPRVTLVSLPHSGVPAIVRNAALGRASGMYVAFLDSDDVWIPQKLERQVAALRRAAGRRWSYTACIRIDETGAECHIAGTRPWRPHTGDIFEQLLTFDAAVGTPTVMVERSLLTEVGGFDEQQIMYEDYELWLRLASRSDVELVDERLTGVRSHAQHFTFTNNRARAVCRCTLAAKARRYATAPRLLRLIDRLSTQYAVNLANTYAETDRAAGLRALFGARPPWRDGELWLGWCRVLLKLALPRSLLALRRGLARASRAPESE